MLVVALTGGIGSGKSTVSSHFEALGVPVIDADIIARELVSPGSPALTEITQAFGPEILQADGTLHRMKLRERVFADPNIRQRLEAILHPRIRSEMARQLSNLKSPYAILVIPLLVEAEQTELADRILVVDCPETIQSARIQARDRLSEEQIQQILAAQTDRASRLAIADDVIDNSADQAALMTQVEMLHQHYLKLAEGVRRRGR